MATETDTAAAVVELATFLVGEAIVVDGENGSVSLNLDRLEEELREVGVRVEYRPRAPFLGELEAVRAEKHVYATRAANARGASKRGALERRVATLERREEEILGLLWPEDLDHEPPDPL